ncbi:hypothetical protein BDAP_001009 [Binucleata daphniae]
MVNPKFHKKLGQHILTSQQIIQTIVTKSKIKPTDTILEIGPGTGALTLPILQKCKKLICIEKDTRLASELVKKVQHANMSHKFELIIGDAITVPFPHFDMCISNTPYQISSPLVFKLLQYKHKASVLMFQREFADRMIARPGMKEYCRLSIAVQMKAKVENIIKVGRKCFVPVPNVDSSVVRIEPIKDSGINMKEFDAMLKICFMRKNRTLQAIFRCEGIRNIMKKYIEKIENNGAVNMIDNDTMNIIDNDAMNVTDNEKTNRANNDHAIDNNLCTDDNEEMDICSEENEHTKKDKKAILWYERFIARILSSAKSQNSRANKMDTEQFLTLFLEFKKAGIHF